MAPLSIRIFVMFCRDLGEAEERIESYKKQLFAFKQRELESYNQIRNSVQLVEQVSVVFCIFFESQFCKFMTRVSELRPESFTLACYFLADSYCFSQGWIKIQCFFINQINLKIMIFLIFYFLKTLSVTTEQQY